MTLLEDNAVLVVDLVIVTVVDIVVVDVFVVVVVHVVAVDPLKCVQIWISNSYDIDDIEFLVVGGGSIKSFSYQAQLLLC